MAQQTGATLGSYEGTLGKTRNVCMNLGGGTG